MNMNDINRLEAETVSDWGLYQCCATLACKTDADRMPEINQLEAEMVGG